MHIGSVLRDPYNFIDLTSGSVLLSANEFAKTQSRSSLLPTGAAQTQHHRRRQGHAEGKALPCAPQPVRMKGTYKGVHPLPGLSSLSVNEILY